MRFSSHALLTLFLLVGCSSATTTIAEDTSQSDPVVEADVEQAEPTAEPVVQDVEPTPIAEPTEIAPAEPQAEPESGAASDENQTPEAAVQTAFDDYRQTLVDFDAAAAAELVTPSTIDYYGRILELGVTASGEELLTSISFSDGLGVLAMRARIGDELLEFTNGQQLFDAGIERGLVGDSVGTTLLERVDVNGDEAFGFIQGIAAFRFELIDDQWRVDLPYSTALIDANETEFLESVSGDGASRVELYNLVALGYQTTFVELAAPLG